MIDGGERGDLVGVDTDQVLGANLVEFEVMYELLIEHVFAVLDVHQFELGRRLQQLIQPAAALTDDRGVLLGIEQAAMQIVFGDLQFLDAEVKHLVESVALDTTQSLLEQAQDNQRSDVAQIERYGLVHRTHVIVAHAV